MLWKNLLEREVHGQMDKNRQCMKFHSTDAKEQENEYKNQIKSKHDSQIRATLALNTNGMS